MPRTALPFEQVHTAVHARLSAATSFAWLSAGAVGPGVEAPYGVIQLPTAPARDTQTTRGHDVALVLRIHTRHAKGRASHADAYRLSAEACEALDPKGEHGPLILSGGHRLLHLPSPDASINSYESGDFYAVDAVLRYDLLTQYIHQTA